MLSLSPPPPPPPPPPIWFSVLRLWGFHSIDSIVVAGKSSGIWYCVYSYIVADVLEDLATSKSPVLRPWRWRWNAPSECGYLSFQTAWSHIHEDCVRHSCCSENLISYLSFCTFKCAATSLLILFIVFEICQLVCIILRYLGTWYHSSHGYLLRKNLLSLLQTHHLAWTCPLICLRHWIGLSQLLEQKSRWS